MLLYKKVYERSDQDKDTSTRMLIELFFNNRRKTVDKLMLENRATMKYVVLKLWYNLFLEMKNIV